VIPHSELGQKMTAKMAMHLSIEEAKKGLGWVSPNPPVGCVILDQNKCLLSSAYHRAYGRPHAEQEALKQIQDKTKLKGAEVYVTLEPCAHFGNTPPCVQALIQYPIRCVYYGQEDSNPKTQGLGIQTLQSKGIQTKKYELFQDSIKDLYKVFDHNMKYQTAFVALKVASSLDGQLALIDGSSRWISSQPARDYVSQLRAYNDAVLIGVGTFLEDNPRLNSRTSLFDKKINKVVILDPSGHSLKLLEQSNLYQVRSPSDIIVVTKHKIDSSSIKIQQCRWDSFKNQFDLCALKSILYKEFGICSLLVEGGALTFSTFLEQEAADEIYQFLSPILLGGQNGISWAKYLKIQSLENQKRLKLQESRLIGTDLLLKLVFTNHLKSG